jgi:hypothetical protein
MTVYDMKMFGEYEDFWGDAKRDRVRGFIQIMWWCYARLEKRDAGHDHGTGGK